MARKAVAIVLLGLLACAALASAQDDASVAMAKNRKYGGHEYEPEHEKYSDKHAYKPAHKEYEPKHHKPEHTDYSDKPAYKPEHTEYEPKHHKPEHQKPEHKEYEPKEHYPKAPKHYTPNSEKYGQDEEEHHDKTVDKEAVEAAKPRSLLSTAEHDDEPESYKPHKHHKDTYEKEYEPKEHYAKAPKHYKPEEEEEYEPKPKHYKPKHGYKPSHDEPEYHEPEEPHMDLPHKLVKVPHMAKEMEFCADVKNFEGGYQSFSVGANAWASFNFEMDGKFVGDASVTGVITDFDKDKNIATINARMLAGPKGEYGTGFDTLLVATGTIQVEVKDGKVKQAKPVVLVIGGGAGALAGADGTVTFDLEGKATFDITVPKQKPEKMNKEKEE